MLDDDEIRRIRDRVCAPLHGTVVEIGFGSGLNVPHYPAAVSRVRAIVPSTLARRLAAPRVSATPVPIEFDGLDGQHLPLPDGSVDCALLTLTLCSIPDQGAAARELLRVLVPGGFVAYVEHGASPDPDVARRQGRMNALNRRLSGCRLDTDVPKVLRAAGFDLTGERTFYFQSGPRWAGYLYEGIGHKPG
jgi:ubiquinone/menaquinone biosynthesis C-methylase UbiE